MCNDVKGWKFVISTQSSWVHKLDPHGQKILDPAQFLDFHPSL